MNSQVHRFYRKFTDEQAPIRLYHEVIGLHEAPHISWEELSKKAPSLPKGWYELSHLKAEDRIEFTRDFWLATLPFLPHAHAYLEKFFASLDDIGIFLTQLRSDSSFECEIVYSLKDESCFYHGSPPCTGKEIEALKIKFEGKLPEDYLAFLKIHDGFSKHTDAGVVKSKHLFEVGEQFREEFEQFHPEMNWKGKAIDSADLIPFYELFGSSSYQCFFSLWTPSEQAGIVYCSPMENRISDFFPTYLDWLVFYLENVGA